jgi:hypothetical protein
MEEMKNAYKDIIIELKGKRQLGGIVCKWEGNFQIDLEEMVGGPRLIHLSQDRGHWWALVNTVVNCWYPYSPTVVGFIYLDIWQE